MQKKSKVKKPFRPTVKTYKRPEDLLTNHGRRRVVGLRQGPALANFILDVISDALDVLINQTFAFFAECHRELCVHTIKKGKERKMY